MSFTAFFKDKNLIPENIRKGVKIGRVKGTLEGGGGTGNNQNITANSSTLEQIFEAEEGYDGIGIFTLLPYALQSKTVNSSTLSQTVTFDNGYNGLLSVTVNPYILDTKTVDSSTVSQTINSSADGLSSVTVNPYVLDTKSLDPSTVSQTVNSSADGMSSVSISAVTSSIDANIQAENIKSGVTILGVTGNMVPGDWVADAKKGTLTDLRSKKLNPNNYSYCYSYLFDHSVDAYRRLPDFTGSSTSVGIGQYMNTFSNSKYWYHNVESGWSQLGSEFPFTYINQKGMKECFMNSQFSYNSTMGSNIYIKFPNLTTIENSALDSAFKNCRGAQKIEFPLLNLTGYSDYGMRSCFENFDSNGYYLTLSMPSLTNVTSHALEAVCKNVSFMNLPTFLPNITKIDAYGMSESFSNSTSSNIMSGAVNFTNLTSVNNYSFYQAFYNRTGLTSVSFPELTMSWQYTFYEAFANCTGLTSVSFPKLTRISANYSFYKAFANCTGLTSVSFPELTEIGTNYSSHYMFSNCTNLATISFPKLAIFNPGLSTSLVHMFYGTNITTATIHPGCLKGNDYNTNLLYHSTGLTSLTLSEDATDNIHLDWQPSLSFNSILSVLSHLDLNTSNKSCTFYTGGITITDDIQGSLQTACDAAVNAGWTINNLTINSRALEITSPSNGTLDPTVSNTIEFDTLYSWTAVTSSNDVVLSAYSGNAGLNQSVTVTVPSGWEGDETVIFTCNNVNKTVTVTHFIVPTLLTKIITNNDTISVAPIDDMNTTAKCDFQVVSIDNNTNEFAIVSASAGTSPGEWTIKYDNINHYFIQKAWNSEARAAMSTNALDHYNNLISGVFEDDYINIIISYSNWNWEEVINLTGGTTGNVIIGDSQISMDIYGIQFYTNWSGDDGGWNKTLVHDYKPALKNGTYGLYDDVTNTWYPCTNGLVTGTV